MRSIDLARQFGRATIHQRLPWNRPDAARRFLCLGVLAASAAAASANPGDRELARRDFTLHPDTAVRLRAMLKLDTYPGNQRALELLLWQKTPASPGGYYVISSGAIDMDRRDFAIQKFTVKPSRASALVDVVWRRRGSTRAREIVYRASEAGLKLVTGR